MGGGEHRPGPSQNGAHDAGPAPHNARMASPTLTFDEFRRDALARGFDEVVAERYGSEGATYWVARRKVAR